LTVVRPARLLRAEAAALLALTVAVYARLDVSWWLFVGLALAPDVAAVGYLRGPRVGATAYNLAHWAALPALLALLGLLVARDLPLAVALVWFAHIALDRLLGYGLKYPTAFKETHLQRV
jgi:hypothetical protein